MARRALGLLVLAVSCLATGATASPSCVATVRGLRDLLADPQFALHWRETSMNDGKPLVLTLLETEGALVLEFVKTGEGLWARSEFVVCRHGAVLEARAEARHMRLGPAAGWLTRLAFANGGTFRLRRQGAGLLHIETAGWSGLFSASASR